MKPLWVKLKPSYKKTATQSSLNFSKQIKCLYQMSFFHAISLKQAQISLKNLQVLQNSPIVSFV